MDSEIKEDGIPSDFFDDFNKEDFIEGLSTIDTWKCDEKDNDNELDNKVNKVKDLRELLTNDSKNIDDPDDLDRFVKPGSRRDINKTNQAIMKDKESKVRQIIAKRIDNDELPPGADPDDLEQQIEEEKMFENNPFKPETSSNPKQSKANWTARKEDPKLKDKQKFKPKHPKTPTKRDVSDRERFFEKRTSAYDKPKEFYKERRFRETNRSPINLYKLRGEMRKHGNERYSRSPIRKHYSPLRNHSPSIRTARSRSRRRTSRSRSRRRSHSRGPESTRRRSRSRDRSFRSRLSISLSPRRRHHPPSPPSLRNRTDYIPSLFSKVVLDPGQPYPHNPYPHDVYYNPNSFAPAYPNYGAPGPMQGAGYEGVPGMSLQVPMGSQPLQMGNQPMPIANQPLAMANQSIQMPSQTLEISGLTMQQMTHQPAAQQLVPHPVAPQQLVPHPAAPQPVPPPGEVAPDAMVPVSGSRMNAGTFQDDPLAKLLLDGKISKEDYMKLTPNKGLPVAYKTPEERGQLLTRCYDAISKLAKLHLPNRLIMNPQITQAEQKFVPQEFCSPLKRQPEATFYFTTSSASTQAHNQQILKSVVSTLNLQVVEKEKKKKKATMVDAEVQTVTPFCEVCDIRSNVQFQDADTKIDNEFFSSSVHTQVIDKELADSKAVFSASGGGLSDGAVSLSHLTPAQLVSQLAARAKNFKKPEPEYDPDPFMRRRNASNPQYNYDQYNQYQPGNQNYRY